MANFGMYDETKRNINIKDKSFIRLLVEIIIEKLAEKK